MDSHRIWTGLTIAERYALRHPLHRLMVPAVAASLAQPAHDRPALLTGYGLTMAGSLLMKGCNT